MTNKLIFKILVARFRLFFTKKRYMGNHPKTKRVITVGFLIVVIGYVGSVNLCLLNGPGERVIIERVGVSVSSSEVAEACDSPDDIAEQSDLIGEEATESLNGSPDVSVGEFSAYNAEIGQTDSDPFTMASGKRVYEGAVANNCLPFGTQIELNGKIYTVEDRMNKRYTKCGENDTQFFDLFLNSYSEAIEFGRQTLEYSVV